MNRWRIVHQRGDFIRLDPLGRSCNRNESVLEVVNTGSSHCAPGQVVHKIGIPIMGLWFVSLIKSYAIKKGREVNHDKNGIEIDIDNRRMIVMLVVQQLGPRLLPPRRLVC